MLNSVLAMVLVDIFDVNRGGGGGGGVSVKMPSCLTCRALREKELS